MRRLLRPAWLVSALVLVVAASWWTFRTGRAADATAGVEPPAPFVARDLADDELSGGHTLSRHVGRSDDQLARRLARERNLAAASTFTDRETAQRAVAAALAAERERIGVWLAKGRRANLVVRWRGDGRPLGRVLSRGSAAAVEARAIRVVLRRRGEAYFVLTAYPEEPR